jgi:CheY-like chemotaxis protein
MLAAVYPTLQSAVLLCIDDNEDVLECEKSFLESFGYSVLAAASGGKGLELASKHSVDVTHNAGGAVYEDRADCRPEAERLSPVNV